MNEQQRDELLLSMKDQITEMNSRLSKVEGLSGTVESLSGTVESLSGTVDGLINKVEDLSNKFDDLSKEVRSISQSVAVIEVEHGSKIQALLDVQVGILKKLDSFEKRFGSNEGILENHSTRIWRLESEVGIV